MLTFGRGKRDFGRRLPISEFGRSIWILKSGGLNDLGGGVVCLRVLFRIIYIFHFYI